MCGTPATATHRRPAEDVRFDTHQPHYGRSKSDAAQLAAYSSRPAGRRDSLGGRCVLAAHRLPGPDPVVV